MARRRARVLMMALQALYLTIYTATLYHAETVGWILEAKFQASPTAATTGLRVIVVLALCGIATRVYLVSGLTFDHPDLPKKFRQLFPALWLMDSIWAASPLLVLPLHDRFGIMLACVALLAYVPFAQKTLMENLSKENPRLVR
jgi:hypothetical protein